MQLPFVGLLCNLTCCANIQSMEHIVLKEWLRVDPARGSWLAKRLDVSYEFVRLMSHGRRPISSERAMQIGALMRVREKSDRLLGA